MNLVSTGFVSGYTTILLPQLKEEDSIIPIDDSMGSWFVSIIGFSLLLGNIITPSFMGKFGRQKTNLISNVPLLIGWLMTTFSRSFAVLMIARFIVSIPTGMSAVYAAVLIGEYTSPKLRGVLLCTTIFALSIGILLVQSIGFILSWQMTALFCSSVCILNILIVYKSPESPSWLANQGRYEECRQAFEWLRGHSENAELEGLITVSKLAREKDKEQSAALFDSAKTMWRNLNMAIRKKEFYKPIIIMFHMYTLVNWCGNSILSAYAGTICDFIIGHESNIPFVIFTVNLQRIVSNVLALYVIKRIKRRTLLMSGGFLNITTYLVIAGYVYAKVHGYIQGHVIIGIVLIHIYMFSIAGGTLILSSIISGEVFPLQYRGLASAVSLLIVCPNTFAVTKTLSFLLENIGLHGAFCLYAAIVTYCFAVVMCLLPETKDKTLQEIEDEFRGKPLNEGKASSLIPLTHSHNGKEHDIIS